MSDVFDLQFAISILPNLLEGAIVTVETTAIGFVIALIVGFPLAIARRSSNAFAWAPVSLFVEFVRSTPILIQIYFVFFVGPQLGIILSPMQAGLSVIGVYYGCFVSEVYRAGLDAVPRGQWEAVRALNIGRFRSYTDIILPQAIPPMIPALGNFLIDMFKATPILSAISVLELMTRAKLIGAETFRYAEPITIVGVVFFILTLLSSAGIRWLERYLEVSRSHGRARVSSQI